MRFKSQCGHCASAGALELEGTYATLVWGASQNRRLWLASYLWMPYCHGMKHLSQFRDVSVDIHLPTTQGATEGDTITANRQNWCSSAPIPCMFRLGFPPLDFFGFAFVRLNSHNQFTSHPHSSCQSRKSWHLPSPSTELVKKA